MVIKIKEIEDMTGGLYCLAPHLAKGKFSMKIGRTINFHDRLNAYHLCFNEGFHLIAILPLKNRLTKKQRTQYVREMEKKVFEILKDDQRTYPNRRRGSEWYATTITKIKKAFKQVHLSSIKEDTFYNYTLPPIFEFEDPFANVYNIEGINSEGKSMRKVFGYKRNKKESVLPDD